MSTDAPQPLPYTLQELALALPAPMPTTHQAVQALLRTPLHLRQADEYMSEYDIATPLITRDGYVIEQVDVREAMPKSNFWRTDENKVFAFSLTFANKPCVPVELLQQVLSLPRFPSDLSGPDPGDKATYSRATEWGGPFIMATNVQPNCVAVLGTNVFQSLPHIP